MTFGETILLKLRGLPVRRIQKAIATAKAAGISLHHKDIAVLLQCGRPVEPVIEALILAKREGVPATWDELCAIDLVSAGQNYDVLSTVRAAIPVRELTFSTFAADMKEPIAGACRNGSRVQAHCHIAYRTPISIPVAIQKQLGSLQERLASRIGALISDAENLDRLQMSLPEHEISLLALAQTVMPTVQKLELKYQPA